ncbi:Shedu anti-phage system protein SduA domain-containing protein [Shewanella algae]|uniref:Shedu anti-phage system protein SduA domain-containing protein n=1 Tax=Shewanella algae TaxID=38313 RepID=UPI0031F500BC
MCQNDIVQQLQSLMNEDGHTEIQARDYIEYAKDLFVHETPSQFFELQSEYRTTNGDIDLIVPCILEDDAGVEKKVVYIWEVKSPQTTIFCYDNRNRVKPTPELVKAENQLLHYYEECKLNQQFRNEFEIVDPEDVRLGGILIGKRDTLVQDHQNYNNDKKRTLYNKASSYRARHFYRASGIKLLTWDKVLNQISGSVVEPVEPEQLEAISISASTEE